MADARCSCGFTESADDHLIDHLLEVFTPPDSRGNDGQPHEELSHSCACGFIPATPGQLDQHFIAVFTPASSIGQDGKTHVALCLWSRAARSKKAVSNVKLVVRSFLRG